MITSFPQVMDKIILSRAAREAAALRDEALGAFKDQTDRPLDWFIKEAEKQTLKDHPKGLRSEKPGKKMGKKIMKEKK